LLSLLQVARLNLKKMQEPIDWNHFSFRLFSYLEQKYWNRGAPPGLRPHSRTSWVTLWHHRPMFRRELTHPDQWLCFW
jgi:hypothetical protein